MPERLPPAYSAGLEQLDCVFLAPTFIAVALITHNGLLDLHCGSWIKTGGRNDLDQLSRA